MRFQRWAASYPVPAEAQKENLRRWEPRLSPPDRVILRAVSDQLFPNLWGPLRDAFLSLPPYKEVLLRAERGEYPLAALRSLLLQRRGDTISADHLRLKIAESLGQWPGAKIFVLPEWLYRAAAAPLGYPLAFYRPDSIYIPEGTSEGVLLHELLHSAQWSASGSVFPASHEREVVSQELMEALTEEWVARYYPSDLYLLERRALRELLGGDFSEVTLLHPMQMLEWAEDQREDFVQLWQERLSKSASPGRALAL